MPMATSFSMMSQKRDFALTTEERTCTVIFGPEGQYLLGATTLEDFDLMVDPTQPNPSLVSIDEFHI